LPIVLFVIGKYAYIFGWGGEDEFSAGRILHRENFPWRRKFPGGELFRGNFTLSDLPKLLYEILYNLDFSLQFNLRVEMLRVIVWDELSLELNCPDDIPMGRGFSVEPGILVLFKKLSEIK
jgi:hypothetical protein